MNSCATVRSEHARCAAPAGVKTGEWLSSIAGAEEVHPEIGGVLCELVAGHGSSHAALVATAQGGDEWWWLRWGGPGGETIEVTQIDPCDAELPQGRYADDCLLPDGHPGPHSFHLPPLPSLTEERHSVRLRSDNR